MIPQAFMDRMKEQLGGEFEAFAASYSAPAARGLRVNGLKSSAASVLREIARCGLIDENERPAECGLPDSPPFMAASASPSGFVLPPDAPPLGEHAYHRAGLFYLQEPSAMCAAELLAPEPGERVLDLCAAPGGKTAALADFMRGEGLLVANEPVKSRAATLVSNIERLGVTNAVVTVAMPDALAKLLPNYFNAVMVDAPCSGEGMFRKDPGACREWSLEHVRACAGRQREILQSAQLLTAPGGRIVYSTCTFSPEEDEENARWFVNKFPRFRLVRELKLYPHSSDGEGHYAALFVDEAGMCSEAGMCAHAATFAPASLTPANDARFTEFMLDTFAVPPDMPAYVLKDGRVAFMPFALPQALTKAYILRAGVLAGSLEKGRFEPEHALFMAAFTSVKWRREVRLELDDARLSAFFRGEQIAVADAVTGGAQCRGFAPVTVSGHCVGFVKVTDGDGKNKLPKGLRK